MLLEILKILRMNPKITLKSIILEFYLKLLCYEVILRDYFIHTSVIEVFITHEFENFFKQIMFLKTILTQGGVRAHQLIQLFINWLISTLSYDTYYMRRV